MASTKINKLDSDCFHSYHTDYEASLQAQMITTARADLSIGQTMNILDLIIIVTLSIAFLLGWKIRAIHLLGMVASLFLGIWIANHYHIQLLSLYQGLPPAINVTLAWLTTFLIAVISISIIFSFVAKTFEFIRLKWLDRLLGAALSLVFILVVVIISLLVINTMAKTFQWKIIDHSVLAKSLLQTVQPFIQNRFHHYPKLKNILI